MRLWIAVHLSRLPLEAFQPNWSPDIGSVVLDQERVLVASDIARRAGIRVGMRRGAVLMLQPETQIHERSAAREEEALRAVALALLQYTPLVAHAEEESLCLDIGQSLRLFAGPRALCRRVRESMAALGFTVSLGCAPTARGAWLLARGGGGRTLRAKTLARRLDRLPVLLAPPARPFASWLEGIGCQTLGDLRRLPRPGLKRRCGGALLDLLDEAHGTNPEMHEWIAPPAQFNSYLELFGRIESADLLLAGAQRLLQQMTGWLVVQYLAVTGITIRLEHERGRQKRPPTLVEVALAEPTWRDEHLVRLLKERLSSLDLDAAVIGMALEASQLQPMAPVPDSLFPDEGGSASDHTQLLEVLVARLGAENVLHAAPRADYRPEVANAWVSVQETLTQAQRKAQLPPNVDGMLRPTWLLAKPIPLLLRENRPFYASPLRVVAGPERIEAGWWSDARVCDYYVMEGVGDRAMYWVYKERVVTDDDNVEPRWFLHGLFG